MTNTTKIPKEKRDNRSLLQKYAAAPHIVWSVLFVLVPLVFVAYYAFTDAEGSFTLVNVAKFFTPTHLSIFFRSLKLAVIATAICLLVGYPIAYAISRCKPKTQRAMILLLMVPMWMNFLLRTYSIMVLIQDKGLINTFLGNLGIAPIHLYGTEGAVVLGMVYDYLPYMILPIYSVMSKIDYRLEEAASDLGCNTWGVIRKVTLPLSLSGVISGVTMVLVPSISTFYISQKLGGEDTLMIGDLIEQNYYLGDYNMAASLSLVLMLILMIGLAVANRFSDGDEGGGMVL